MLERHVGLLAEIEHRPVLHFVLPDRQLRHAVAVRRAAAFRAAGRANVHVDGALVELDLALDVPLPALDEVGSVMTITSLILVAGRRRTRPSMLATGLHDSDVEADAAKLAPSARSRASGSGTLRRRAEAARRAPSR